MNTEYIENFYKNFELSKMSYSTELLSAEQLKFKNFFVYSDNVS